MEILAIEKDFTTNIIRSFDEIDGNWKSYSGLVIGGTHSPERQDVENKINQIKLARESNIPFLGICAGFEWAILEYARNVLKIKEADTQELNLYTPIPMIEKMPELRVGQRQVVLYGEFTVQSFWHNYKMNPKYIPLFVKDWVYSFNQSEEVMDFMVLKTNFFHLICQFHPEYQSSKDNPHPVLKDFLEATKIWTRRNNGFAGRLLH